MREIAMKEYLNREAKKKDRPVVCLQGLYLKHSDHGIKGSCLFNHHRMPGLGVIHSLIFV